MAAVTAVNNNPADRNADATVHVGQLDDRVTDELLWELMVQAGPVKHVYIPRDRITGKHHGYGFCEFRSVLDAAYAAKILNMIPVFGKPIRLQQSSADRQMRDVGANLFVGNLADSVDEKLLYDAFSAFGAIIEAPYIMRDPDTNVSKGYGFVKYAAFEASDAALATMNGQYIANRPIVVQYAFRKDSGGRVRHGTLAERTLAAAAAQTFADSSTTSASSVNLIRPHTMFADRPPHQNQAATKVPNMHITNNHSSSTSGNTSSLLPSSQPNPVILGAYHPQWQPYPHYDVSPVPANYMPTNPQQYHANRPSEPNGAPFQNAHAYQSMRRGPSVPVGLYGYGRPPHFRPGPGRGQYRTPPGVHAGNYQTRPQFPRPMGMTSPSPAIPSTIPPPPASTSSTEQAALPAALPSNKPVQPMEPPSS